MRQELAILTGLAVTAVVVTSSAAGDGARADLLGAGGQRIGTATFTEADGQVRIVVEAAGLTPGRHGIHVHAVGRCDPPAFASAGSHLNPDGKKHGLDAPEGAHAGDLPNLVADASGQARYEATTSRLTLADGPRSVFDADGSSLVIHEQADDQVTDPTGNSGGRVACGPIVPR